MIIFITECDGAQAVIEANAIRYETDGQKLILISNELVLQADMKRGDAHMYMQEAYMSGCVDLSGFVFEQV